MDIHCIHGIHVFHGNTFLREAMPRLFAEVGCAPLGSYNQPLVLKPLPGRVRRTWVRSYGLNYHDEPVAELLNLGELLKIVISHLIIFSPATISEQKDSNGNHWPFNKWMR